MLIGLVGGYLIGFGILTAMAIDRMLYDHRRAEVLSRYEATLRAWQAQQMALERGRDGSE
jgi:hypothetical protein